MRVRHFAGMILGISIAAAMPAGADPATGSPPPDSPPHKGLFETSPGDKDSPLPPDRHAQPPQRAADPAPESPPPAPAATVPAPSAAQPLNPTPPARLALPTAGAREQAIKIANDLFNDDIKGATTPAAKDALAQKLLATAESTTDDPAGRFVLLEMARDQAADADDADLALNAVAQLDRFYTVDALAMQGDVISRISRKATTTDQQTVLVDRILPMTQVAMNAERYDLARQWADLALASAQKARDRTRASAVNARIHEITSADVNAKLIAKLLDSLKTHPDDPEANSAVGLYRCVDKGDWHAGLPNLARGGDLALKALAEEELKVPADPSAQLHLAGGWWDAAEKSPPKQQKSFREHAAVWYATAAPGLAGLSKALAERRAADGGHPVIKTPPPLADSGSSPSKPMDGGPAGSVGQGAPAVNLLVSSPPGRILKSNDEIQLTAHGILVGEKKRDTAYFNTFYQPKGEYDVHLILSVVSAQDGPLIRLHFPIDGLNYQLVIREHAPKLALGVAPCDAAKSAGAKQFGGNFGTHIDGNLSEGTTLDLRVRARRSGIAVLKDDKLVFEHAGLSDLDHPDKKVALALDSNHDVLLVRRYEVTELSENRSDQPPAIADAPTEPNSAPAAAGPVHSLFRPVGAEGGPHEWKVTDEGMIIGGAPKGWAYYNSAYSPQGEYDLHMIATVTKVDDVPALRLILPEPEGGHRVTFDIGRRSADSCAAGFVPSPDLRQRGANRYSANFGAAIGVGLAVGQTFDLTFRMRSSGITVLWNGKPWFARKGYQDLAEGDLEKGIVSMKATHDIFLIQKLEVVEVP